MVKNRISADLHDYKITESGIENFYWPINHNDMTKFGDSYMHVLSKIFNSYDQDATIYRIIANYFANEVCGVFQADLLKKRLEDDDVELNIPSDWRVWPYIFDERPPPAPILLDRLRNSAPKTPIFKKITNPSNVIKIFKRLKFNDGRLTIDGMSFSLKENSAKDYSADMIVVTQRTPLIEEHINLLSNSPSPKKIHFCRSGKWFSAISDEEASKHSETSDVDKAIRREMIDAIALLYTNSNLVLNKVSKEFFERCLSEMVLLTKIHYDRLLQRSDIPLTLWTGSGGNIWDLMVRLAVLSKGGQVVGHDHGGGTAHANVTLVGFIELWACDEFITFNQKQAELLTTSAKTWPLLGNTIPKITSLPCSVNPEQHITRDERFLGSDFPIKNIVFASTLYDQDRGRTLSFYPDLTYIDWQSRCISWLKQKNYNVFFKPHPESQTQPPDAYKKILKVTVIDDRLEDIIHQADLFLIDYTYTSILMTILKTNTPIIIVDFDDIPFHEDALEQLSERASYVRARLDKNNRVSIDWGELESAIQDSKNKCNNHNFLINFLL